MTRLSYAVLAIAIAIALLLAPAQAEWKAEYGAQSFEVQQWYRNAELTKAAQTRFPFKKCCDKSDVVKTEFKVDRSSGGDQWLWWDEERQDWRLVPEDIIHWTEHAPNGLPTLFIYDGKPTCFFPGEEGG